MTDPDSGDSYGAPPKGAVLVTGATGFVGSALVPALQAQGRSVRPLVRAAGSSATDERTSAVVPPVVCADTFRDIDCVVHLAARVHVMHEHEPDPIAAFRRVNVSWTRPLAQAAAEAGVRRFIFISSIKVNGEFTPPGRPFTAHDSPAPVGAYALSKHEAELALLELARESAMEIVIIRPPLIYGPRVKGNFEAMMRWLRAGLPLPLGAVDNRRTLLAVDNLVSLIDTCIDHPRVAGRILLAGDDEDLSTAQLLRRMASALGTPARLVPVPVPVLLGVARLLRRSETAQRLCANLQVDTRPTRELLGWDPPISVDEGLRRAAVSFLALEAGRRGR